VQILIEQTTCTTAHVQPHMPSSAQVHPHMPTSAHFQVLHLHKVQLSVVPV